MSKIFIFLIKIYQKSTNFLEKQGYIRKNCKFHPSCSEYSIEAFKKYGFIKGFLLTFKRILRCNPFSSGGFDPLK